MENISYGIFFKSDDTFPQRMKNICIYSYESRLNGGRVTQPLFRNLLSLPLEDCIIGQSTRSQRSHYGSK